jgi:preprotein translocase subunit YajC
VFLAQDNGGEGGSLLFPLLMIVALFAIFYFMLIRPQRRRREAQQQLQSGLSVGDDVVTIGGLYGTVVEVDEKTVILETYEGVYNRYARGAISEVVSNQDEPAESSSESPAEATDSKPFQSNNNSSDTFKSDSTSDATPEADQIAERRDGKD